MKSGHLTRVKMVIIGVREVEEHEGIGRWCGRKARHFTIWTIKELGNPGHSMLSEAS